MRGATTLVCNAPLLNPPPPQIEKLEGEIAEEAGAGGTAEAQGAAKQEEEAVEAKRNAETAGGNGGGGAW